jgi:hypothetical protein
MAALEETSARSRAQVTQLDSELARAASREAVLIRDLACVQSVRDVLEAGVRSRDAQILGSSERIAELTEGLSSESKDLEQTRTDRAQLEQEVASTRLNLEQVQAVRDGLERELLAARSQAEAVTRGRAVAEASLKRREMELAENEQRAGEMQRALEEASREAARVGAENQRLLGEVARLSAMATTSRGNDAAAKANEVERSRLADEVKALKNDMEAQVRIRAGIEAVAKAQDAAAAELRLQLAAATAQRRALDAELEAVSASHAALEKKLAAMGGGDGRFEACVVLAVQELPGEGARQVVSAAGGPGALGTDLHLDVVELAVGIAGEDVEDDLLPGKILGRDVGVQDLDNGKRWLAGTHGVDEFGEQVRGACEEALEDGVVLGIEKWGGVHAGDSFRGVWRGGCRAAGRLGVARGRCL